MADTSSAQPIWEAEVSYRDIHSSLLGSARLILRRMAQLLQRQVRCLRAGCGLFAAPDRLDANERAARLLSEALSPAQRRQYETDWCFDVTGGESGTRYRIRYGRSMNIDELGEGGRRVRGWCFVPQGDLAPPDVMLAQKLALELFESEALRVANKTQAREGAR